MRTAKLLTLLVGGLLLASRVDAGVNQGFTAKLVGPTRIENAEVGQQVSVTVSIRGTVEVKGTAVLVAYDPTIVSYTGFTVGDLTEDPVDLSSPPREGQDGLAVVEGGSTVLGPGITSPTTGGVIGAFHFDVIAEFPESGSQISVRRIEVNTSGEEADRDVLVFGPRELSMNLVRTFPNVILDVAVERRHDGALVTWNTRFAGYDDLARVRPRGSSDDFVRGSLPLAGRLHDQTFEAFEVVRAQGADLSKMSDGDLVDFLKDELGLPRLTPNSVFREIAAAVRELNAAVRSRTHVAVFRNLQAMTEYEFELLSVDLNSRRSQVHKGRFTTRGAPDLRPLFVNQFDVQVTSTGATVSFGTNRPVSTAYTLHEVGLSDPIVEDTVNEEGEDRSRFSLENLTPGTEYEITVNVDLINGSDLIAAGLPADAATKTIVRRFRTRLLKRAMAMLGPPVKLVGAERASIVFDLNQPVDAFVDYGLVPVDGSGKPLQIAEDEDEDLYEWQQESTSTLNQHNITLSNLDPNTLVRYAITLVNAEGDTFTTHPSGNFQWSRDLMFRTAAAGDTLPPEVILGPVVAIRDVLVIVRFVTDVPTSAIIYVGTAETYRTEDEFEFTDLTVDGELRFTNEHSIIVSGLDAGESYSYRLEIESTNDKTTVYEPSAGGTAKAAGVLQPPGGGGGFTTSNDPDTTPPVILAGPSVSSKSHKTAIIEWWTDEPADSEVSFGLASIDEDGESSAVSTTDHKMTLSNLESGGTYTYLVGSTDASLNGVTLSPQAVFTTDPEVDLTAPTITSAPTLIHKSHESATIQWKTDEDATAEITFGTEAASLGFIRTLPSTDKKHEITLTNLQPSTTYFYQAASEDLSNNGPTMSEVLSLTTDAQADVLPPAVFEISTKTSDDFAIIIWKTDELADSFVDFGTVSGFLDVTVGDGADVTDHKLTLTNLTPATTYFYTVGSIDRSGNGPIKSVEQSFTTNAAADITAPATPAGLTGTAGSAQAALSWTANSELDLAGYNVYRRVAGSGAFSPIATRLSETSYTDLGLTNGVAYEYQISAIDGTSPPNESDETVVLALTPTTDAAPTVPTNLSVGGSLTPTFSFANAAPATGGTLTYTVQVSTKVDFSDVTVSKSNIAEGFGTTSWTTSRTLVDEQTYYWRARAVEGALSGPFSEAKTFVATSVVQVIAGDFDGSGDVTFDDFFLFVDAFGKPVADFPAFDLDGVGTTINLDDFFLFVDAFNASVGKASSLQAFAHRMDPTARMRLDASGGPMGAAIDAPLPALPRDVVQLRVFVDDVHDLKAYGLVLTYDPSVVSFGVAGEGPGHLLESQGGETGLFQVLDERPGRVAIANGLIDGEPVSGSGLLAELTFQLVDRARASEARFDLQQAFLAASADDVRRALAVESARLRPAAFALGHAYPNPFNPETHIDFALAADTPVSLDVFDVLGRRVRTLVQAPGVLPAGYYSVTWDGRDHSGRGVGNGLYFYRLHTPAFQKTGKMMVLK